MIEFGNPKIVTSAQNRGDGNPPVALADMPGVRRVSGGVYGLR